jgi:F0F1-type ATP synthase delta subunit
MKQMKNIYEIFDEVENAKTRRDKILVLQYNQTQTLRDVLRGIFDKNVQFTVKEIPKYKPSNVPPGMGYTTLHKEIERAYLFEANNPRVPPTFSDSRKREILIQILEALETREAEVFMSMLLKKNPVKGLTVSIVNEAFPQFNF